MGQVLELGVHCECVPTCFYLHSKHDYVYKQPRSGVSQKMAKVLQLEL